MVGQELTWLEAPFEVKGAPPCYQLLHLIAHSSSKVRSDSAIAESRWLIISANRLLPLQLLVFRASFGSAFEGRSTLFVH